MRSDQGKMNTGTHANVRTYEHVGGRKTLAIATSFRGCGNSETRHTERSRGVKTVRRQASTSLSLTRRLEGERTVGGSLQRPLILNRKLQQAVAAVNVELRGNIFSVGFDGAIADKKLIGDFFARLVESNGS